MSSYERKQFEIGERCLEIHEEYNWTCQFPGCDKKSSQIAHRISKSRSNIKSAKRMAAEIGYIINGGDIIHHRFNLVAVCNNLAHNSYFNIGFETMERQALCNEIFCDLIEKGMVKKC